MQVFLKLNKTIFNSLEFGTKENKNILKTFKALNTIEN